MRRKVAGWGLAVVLVLVVAACGQTKDASPTVDAGATDAQTAAFLSGAASKTAAVTTGKLAMTMTLSGVLGGTGPVVVKGTGAFDNAAHQAQLSFDMSALTSAFGRLGTKGSSLGLDQPFEEVISDGHLYLKAGALGALLGAKTPWVELTGLPGLTQQLKGTSGFGLDPNDTSSLGTDYLTYLQGLGGSVIVVGTETIDGVETTHYKADVDLAQALAKAGDRLSPEAKKRLQDLAGKVKGTMPVEVWASADGIVHRVTMTMDPSAMGMSKAAGSMSLTIDFTDLGQPVQITVPPADQVSPLDLGAKLKGLGGLSGGSGGN